MRIVRRLEEGFVNGYVLDVGPKWIIVAVVSDEIWFNGFQCFRIHDIASAKPDPHVDFVESALRERGERCPRKPRVRLESLETLLTSASRLFPLLAIHRELVAPDVCQIGRILDVRNGRVALQEITPDAVWEDAPVEYKLKEITQVGFGGNYEDALHTVAQARDTRRGRA